MTLVYTSNILQSANLVQHQVDVYILDFSKFYYQTENFKAILSAAETSRMQRYPTWALQDKFIVQHGLTRQILGYYLQTSPEDIEIDAPKFGKPKVQGIHFNISHTDNYLAVAVSNDIPVGVDIESMDRNVDLNHVAAIVLSDAERMKLHSLPVTEQKITLLQTWVCKEAYWKYVGKGLNEMINQFEVAPTAENDIYTMNSTSDKDQSHQIHSFVSQPQRLVSAVAYQGNNANVNIKIDELPVLI